jgi:hypothetical protein
MLRLSCALAAALGRGGVRLRSRGRAAPGRFPKRRSRTSPARCRSTNSRARARDAGEDKTLAYLVQQFAAPGCSRATTAAGSRTCRWSRSPRATTSR